MQVAAGYDFVSTDSRNPMSDQDSPSRIQSSGWQNEYRSALLETDRQRLREKIDAAEAAIFKRLKTLSQSGNGRLEHQAIEDALQNLRVLKRVELHRRGPDPGTDRKPE
jgi:hypothetical protein